MGLDAKIYFISNGDPDLDFTLPSGFDVCRVSDRESYLVEENGATHCISTCARYYGPGYERGDWPRIAHVLMMLFASESVSKVWYGFDCTEFPSRFNPEDLLETCKHYMAHGCRPYRR